jgi:hypothetical protein
MSDFLLSAKGMEAKFKPLQSNAGFLLDLEGHKIIALKLPSKVAKEISGQERQTSGGVLARLRAKLGFEPETEPWLTVTSVDNPLLEDCEKFGALVAPELTTATGTSIAMTDLAISASMPITEMEQPPENVECKDGLSKTSVPRTND